VPVAVETWDYGPHVAEMLHVGPFANERTSVDGLLGSSIDYGYEVAGSTRKST
jgi:hypothetical protein